MLTLQSQCSAVMCLLSLLAGINEIRFTQHLLLECLDIRSILELGHRVEDVSDGKCVASASATELFCFAECVDSILPVQTVSVLLAVSGREQPVPGCGCRGHPNGGV